MKKYDNSQKRVMGGSGYTISIAIIAVLAAALMVFMLIILPAIEEEAKLERRIVSIEYPEAEIGVGDELDKIFVQVSYSDGYTTAVALGDMLYKGLDRTKEGQQNISVTYGGFEQVLPVNVKSVNCSLSYQASTGGRVDGEVSQSVPSGKSGNKVIARPEVGYIFANWSDGNPNAERKDANVTTNATYIANFEKARYIVIFRYPDGTVAREQIVTYNESPTQVPVPSDPKMQVYGYVFDRWSLPFEKVTQDMTIDPVFVKKATDVSVETTKNNRGEVLGTLDLPKEGYYPKNERATLRANPMQSRSFESWQIKSYDNTWIEISVNDIRNYDNFKLIDIGWQGNSIIFEAGQTGDSNEFYLMFTPNLQTDLIEIRANFVYDESTITFINSMSSNAGNIEKTIILSKGEEIGGENISEPVGSGLGYNFIGWFRDDNSVVDEFGNDIAVKPDDTFTQPATLVARWQKKYFRVTFLTGDGDLPNHTVYVLYQETLAAAVEEAIYINPVAVPGIPTQIPKNEHYIFIGWYLVGDGNILTDIVIDEDYKVYEDINVRPKFIPISHDLELEIDGAGRAERKKSTEVGFTTIEAGINKINETERYIYRFYANDGYQIVKISVNGTERTYSGNRLSADVEIDNPDRDMTIKVVLIPKTYVVTIQNGLLNDAGNIRYVEKVDGIMVERSSNLSVINFNIEHNTSRNIYVSAKQTHFVDSITVGQQVISSIPQGSSEYTIVLNANTITSDTTIIIEYNPFAYLVDFVASQYVGVSEVYYNPGTDSYIEKPGITSPYPFGDNPMFMFQAQEGYYIKGLKINGRNVDLYSPDLGFDIFNIIVNNFNTEENNDSTELKDERITDFIFQINNISSNFAIETIYAPLFYNINISKQGRGEIDIDYMQTAYNESIQVNAETDGGYYVKGYQINGEAFEFEDALELQTIDINNITTDIEIVVIFSIATYNITFDGSSNGGRYATVRKDNEEFKQLNVSYAAEHNSSNKFTLQASTGYYISRIVINNNELVIPKELVIPNKATQYDLQVDNIISEQHIVINCQKFSYTINTIVNNDLYGSATSQITVDHGSNAIINISYEDGYMLESISEGSLSEDYKKLTLISVTQNKTVTINFRPITYYITSLPTTNGGIIAKTTALYNEEIFVQVVAFNGYVVDSISINGNNATPAQTFSTYSFAYTITENITISADFVLSSYDNPQIIDISQNGGNVIGSTTIYDNINSSVIIEAPEYHYISAITGQIISGQPSFYALVLDGSLLNIDVEYQPEVYDIDINSPINGSVGIEVSDDPETGFATAATATYGQHIRIMFYPDEGYTVATIKINGQLITDYTGADSYYTYTGFNTLQNIEISYALMQFNIFTEVSGGSGIISTDNNYFEYGSSVLFKIIPSIGYKISTININGDTITGQEKQLIIDTNLYEVVAGSQNSKRDIQFRVSFEHINQRLNVSLYRDGEIKETDFEDIQYGEIKNINISAVEYYFIQAIEIDGIRMEIDNTNLFNYTFDNKTQKYTAGVYKLLITKDTNVIIYFARNVYSVTIMQSVNGVTTVNSTKPIDEGLSETLDWALNITQIEHGDFIQICMKANTGYNISKLYINSQEVFNFKNDNVNPNNNRLINYIYPEGISNNILIRVDYQINYYKFQFETINESPNFKEFDTTSASYGIFSVLGNYNLEGNVYSGIPHGENFRISIDPVREKGYIISGVTITYIDPDSEEQSLIYINPQVGGMGSTILRTGAILFFSELMGQYASAMFNDVQNIQIRFTKETFVYEQEVVTAAHTGTISTRIYHPNDSSRALTVGSTEPTELVLVNGEYEFGLGYTVTIVPSTGYTRTDFYLLSGDVRFDRNSSVRANTYNSILQSDLFAKVEYMVNRYDITFTYEVYSFDGVTRINNPGALYGTIGLVVNGADTVAPNSYGVINYTDCAYGSLLQFTVMPEYATQGYYIHSFVVGSQNITNSIVDKNSDFVYNRTMGDNALVATVVFKINTYSISFIHEGDDGRNSVVSETPGKIPWDWGAVLRLNTDEGYNLLSLEVYQNGEWQDRIDDIIYNHMHNLEYRDILELSNIKEDIIIKAIYARKEYDITVLVNDLNSGSIRVDIIGSFYQNYQDIPQTYSEKIEEGEGWVYDPILGGHYWGTIEYRWDVVTMQAKHYDELLFYLMPADGYRIKELIEEQQSQFNKVKVELFKYVDGERVAVKDSFGNPVVYYINTTLWENHDDDYRRFVLPTGIRLTSDIEVQIDFVLKDYEVSLEKTPVDLSGVSGSTVILEKLVDDDYIIIDNEEKLNHFDNIMITIKAKYGLSLKDKNLRINDLLVSCSSYTIDAANEYIYTFILEINDQLLNSRNNIEIVAQFERNNYNINITIYDNKSGQTTYGDQASTLMVETVSAVSHGNQLAVRPVLSEGYSVVGISINDVDYSLKISNMNLQFSLNITGDIVDILDVHNPDNNTIEMYFITDINLHISSIRAFVYELGVDNYSDIAGNTTITYNPDDTMVVIGGEIKYEYFTRVTVSADARSTPEKSYRFAYFQEQIPGVGWRTVRDDERGIELSGDNNSIMQYTINVNEEAGVFQGDRIFRVVYFRVLTVNVTVMPEYKYTSGYHTTGNMRYLPYLTVEAMIGSDTIEDKNPNNAPIYAKAAQEGSIPYVERYTYYIDSGAYLKLTATDNDTNNKSALDFYDKLDSTSYQIINNISITGIRILEDRDIYLVGRNQTMLSFDINTIKNETGVYGGSLTWRVINKDNTEQTATVYRGSMNSARVLDTVKVTVKPTENYRFTGLYVKNVDQYRTQENGELIFVGEGQVGEWTLIDTSTDLIQINTDGQGNTVFTIFVTGNMVMKFEFYRTFKLTYDLDYEQLGDGPGELQKDNNSSSVPIYTQMVGGKIDYEIFDYDSQIRLIAPETNEDYQFVGWLVNGQNIYTDLDIRFPEQAYYSYWFRLYQNNEGLGIRDGLNLRNESSDVFEINIVAIYQPIYKLAVINESYFYDEDDDHWNTWRPSINVELDIYEYFTNAQVMNGESEGNPYALSMLPVTKNIIMNYEPYDVMSVYNTEIPPRAITSAYNNTIPEWSVLRELVDSNPTSGWSSRKVFSVTEYYKMLYKTISNPDLNYNEWTDNILYLNTILTEGMALTEWQYYDFTTGKFIEIPYVSEPIMSGGSVIGHTNNAKKASYYINLSECDFLDHTKPFVIRPKYQKKVTLNLGKKAYYDYLGDFTTIYNNAQTPQIYNSHESDELATFDYYERCIIIPRPAPGYRFINWFKNESTDEIDNTLESTTVPNETTEAWFVRLKFEFGEQEQNFRLIHARYIRQWEINIISKNLATGDWAKNDAPKLVLNRIYDLTEFVDITDESRYIKHSSGDNGDSIDEDSDWQIHLTIDAGLAIDVDMNMDYTPGALQGYNPEFDKFYSCTNLNEEKGEFANYVGNEVSSLRVSAYNPRTIIINYESFGELIFENLMLYAGIRLTDIMSNYIKDRFAGEIDFGPGPIVVFDGDDGVIDGRASFDRIPIRDVSYTGSGDTLYTFNYVPYGFKLEQDNYITIDEAVLSDNNIRLAHFDSRRKELIKRVTINYQNYKLFGIEHNTQQYGPPGTMTNPYLIGVDVNNSSTLSSVAEARKQFRNIEVFFDNNGDSCDDIVFKLMQDIHLNSGINVSNPTAAQIRDNSYNWVPMCYKNNRGFNGVLLGNGKTLRSLYVNGLGKFAVTNSNAIEGDETQTKYDYQTYGYGIFSAIENGTIIDLKLGTAAIMVDKLLDSRYNEAPGIGSNVGLLAARVKGSQTVIKDVEIIQTDAEGYVPGYNIYIKGSAASNVGVIAGSVICQTTMIAHGEYEVKSIFENIHIKTIVYLNAVNYIGALAGHLEKAKVTNFTITSGTITVETANGNYLGGAIGRAIDCDIQDSYITATFKIGSNNANISGGMIAHFVNEEINSIITNCYITGNSNSYVMATRSNSTGTNPDINVDSSNVGGIIGYNEGIVENCSIRSAIRLYGAYCGGIVGTNVGIIRDILLEISDHDFNIHVETPTISYGGYGIITGANRFIDEGIRRIGVVIDCGIIGQTVDTNLNTTNAKLYVYPLMPFDKTLKLKPTYNERTAVIESAMADQGAYTSIGGLVGLNQGKVFNSYTKKIKILAMKNGTPSYNFHVGGVVGFNQVGSITNGRGVSSCFSDGNAIVLSSIIWSYTTSALATYYGVGGVVGGTLTVSGSEISDFSIRYCYGVNNRFYLHSANFGSNFKDGDKSGPGGLWGDPYQNPDNNNTSMEVNVGLVVGGAKNSMSRAYYSWGATNNSWQSLAAVYGNTATNGGSFRNGVTYDGTANKLLCFDSASASSVYSDHWNETTSQNFFGRLILLEVEISEVCFNTAGKLGINKPAVYGGFISRDSGSSIIDSRVIRTDMNTGQPLYTTIKPDFDSSGNYIGTQDWAAIQASIVPNQSQYNYL